MAVSGSDNNQGLESVSEVSPLAIFRQPRLLTCNGRIVLEASSGIFKDGVAIQRRVRKLIMVNWSDIMSRAQEPSRKACIR